jgi:hypothetical protein
MFFAPDQMRKRIEDWFRQELDRRFAEPWRGFAPVVEEWVDVDIQHGPDALERPIRGPATCSPSERRPERHA